jgi:hypothetical protein
MTEEVRDMAAEVRAELEEIDSVELAERPARFEELHTKLHEALSSIDNL